MSNALFVDLHSLAKSKRSLVAWSVSKWEIIETILVGLKLLALA